MPYFMAGGHIIVGRPKQLDRKTMQLPKHLQRLNLNAAGIDIGSKSHFVAVPEGTDDEPVREFECPFRHQESP